VTVCYIGIGSNLGDRHGNIQSAVKEVGRLENTRVIKKSAVIESAPEGGPAGQGNYLNGVIKIETGLSASSLLRRLKSIEKHLGRKKTVRFGPRTIDLDILLYGDKTIKRKGLVVPHPRMFERKFVLAPLEQAL